MPREWWAKIQTPDCGNVIPATGSWGHLKNGYAVIIAWYAISVTAIYWLPIKKSVLRISQVIFRTDHYCQAAYFLTAGACIPFWRGGLFVPALYSHPSYKQDRCTWVVPRAWCRRTCQIFRYCLRLSHFIIFFAPRRIGAEVSDHSNHLRPFILSQVRPTVLSTLILSVLGSKK